MAVYRGTKPGFPNPGVFAIDGSIAPKMAPLKGLNEEGLTLTLDEHGIDGWDFSLGTTGLYAFGDGRFYISHPMHDERGWASEITLYHYDEKSPFVKA